MLVYRIFSLPTIAYLLEIFFQIVAWPPCVGHLYTWVWVTGGRREEAARQRLHKDPRV